MGTIENDVVNSTSADESFTMGAGSNVINFDLSNNNVLGTDEIHLTPGEDLILNFTGSQYYSYFNTSLIKWERVNNVDGTVDIAIHTSPYYTLCYVKAETIASDEIYSQSSYYTYYKAITNYYVYDYDTNDWVLNSTNDYAYSQNSNTTSNYYGLQTINQAGQLNGWYQGYSDGTNDLHIDRYNDGYIGLVTSQIDYNATLNTIIIKNIGAQNAANSVKIQYTNPNNGATYTCYEYVDGSRQDINFIARKYDIGNKSEITNEDQVLQGSFLDETFYAGYGDDIINTVGGTNEIVLVNGGNDVITLGAGADTINGKFNRTDAYEQDLNTNTVTEGFYIKNGNSEDSLLLYNYGTKDFYKDGNNLVIIQNWQYNSDGTRLSKFTLEDYFSNENRIEIKYYGTTIGFNESDTEVYRINSDGYISCNSSNNYTYYLDMDGEIYSYDYDSSTQSYTYNHVTQNSSILYNRLGITPDNFSETRNDDYYYETGEINGKVYYSSYRDTSIYSYLYTKENGIYTPVVENKSAKFANDLGIVWENVTSIGSIVESDGNIVNGTNSSEAIVATGQATVTTGDGDDIVYTSEANDTIIINGSGNKTIVIDSTSGDDTIDIQNHEGYVYLYLPNSNEYSDYIGYNFYKDKDGDNKDLIVERYKRVYVTNHYETIPTGRTIIKDYFTFTTAQSDKIFIKTMDRTRGIAINKLYIDGDEGEENVIGGTDLKDVITGKELVDSITTGKGDDLITPNQGDDIININDSGAKTIYLGKGDGNDTINITNDFQNSYLYLSYTDAYAGLSYQIDDDNNLITYRTYVDGDDILTEGVTVTGITGVNASGKIYFYRKEAGSVYEQGTSIGGFAANTPCLIQGSPTEGNTINTSDDGNVSHLITGGSGKDNITSSGEIEHIYTGAEDDTISVNSTISTSSSVNSLVYSGSGNDQITVNGTDVSKTYVYAEDGSDIINVASGKVYVYAGDGNDAINVSGGSTEIYPGAGEDTINITGGTGGLIIIKRGEGDKTINFDGASGTRYSFRFDNYSNVIYYKREKNLIAEGKYTRYYYDENGNYQEETITETHTMNNFFDPNHSKVDSDTAINGNIKYVRLNNEGIFDTELNATVFEGTACEDFINGTNGVDIITTGSADDNITPGKGDDLITINGAGDKDFYYTKGDGNDVITIADDVVFYNGYESSHESADKIYFGDKTYYGQYYERPERWAYSINDDDLILHRIYSNNGDALTETTTIKGIKGVNDDNTEVNAQNIASWDGGLNISGHLYIQNVGNINNLSQMNIGKENEANNITTTAGVKNTAIGGNESDIITSGGTDDYIVAGAGNDSIVTTASTVTIYAGTGNDNITSSANTATIYDGAGDDTIVVTQGTNNIYLGAGSDTVRISGGQGTINLFNGAGNNTLIFENNNENGTCDLNGVYNINLSNNDSYGFNYDKSGDDLVITRGNSTLTVKGLFGSNQLSNGNNLTINGSTLSSMSITGNYDKSKKATVFKGSNYNDYIYGTAGKDIITTGAGNDNIYLRKGNDTVLIDGSGNKRIYYEKGGNNTIQLGEGVSLGEIYIDRYDGYSLASSYKIVNNDFVWYRTYIDGDKFKTESTRITGIKPVDSENPSQVTYENISNSSGGLNISGKLTSKPYLKSAFGNFKKANKIITKAGTNNLVLGGKKSDKITLNGLEDCVYTGAGADNITVKGSYGSDTVYAGSGNDIITLNANDKGVDIYGGKGNDKIYANGTGRYNFYSAKGDGNDTIILGKKFNQKIYFYNTSGDNPTQMAYKIDKNKNLILYKVYYDGDNIVTNSVKITGIKSRSTENPADVTFNNISYSSGGLNISGSYISDYNKNIVMGNAKKANKLSTKAGDQSVVIGGNKNDKVTLNGYDYAYTGKGNDTINIYTTGSKYVYAGAGNDIINVKNGNNYIYSEKGKDRINISGGSGYIYLKAGGGNDTITFSGTDFGNYNIRYEGYNSYNNYYKSGDDLLIKCTYKDTKGKTKTETHTIKGYFAMADILGNKLRFGYGDTASYCLSNYGLNIVGKYNKKQKATIFNGTDYRDTIIGTKKKDIIYTGEGSDKITAGQGNDEIIINSSQPNQVKYIYLNNGDGNDTIKWAEGAEGIAWLYINPNDSISYEKSGRNLIVIRSYQSGNSIKSERTTIENYYDEEGNPVIYDINEYDYPRVWLNEAPLDTNKSFNRVNYTKSTFSVENDYEFAAGTKYADTVSITSDNSSVFTLAGNDIINVNGGSESNTAVTGGTGKDTINLNTTGNVTVNHLSGDGNDTINFGANIPSRLNISVESSAFNNVNGDIYNKIDAMYKTGKLGLKQSGNDLVITVPTASKYTSKTESVTITDYFSNESINSDNIRLLFTGPNYSYSQSISSMLENYGLWADGVVSDGVTLYTGKDNIVNRYKYNGSGKAVINGVDTESYYKQEYYYVNIGSKSNLTINDKGGYYENMYINTSYKNLKLFINVNSNGKVAVSDDKQLSDNFMIFNKGSLTYSNITNIVNGKDGTGIINIDNYFDETTNNVYTTGTGSIGGFVAGKNIMSQYYSGNEQKLQNIISEGWIYGVCEQVSSWLSSYSNGKYSGMTSLDVIESGNKTDINAMLKVYNSVTYDKNFST